MVSRDQSKHTGQTQAPLPSGTSSSSSKSGSNAFVALPFFPSWSHRISRCTQAIPKLLCLQSPQALIQSQRAMNLSPCHFARHGLTGSVEAHRPDQRSFVFRHLKLWTKVIEQCICHMPDIWNISLSQKRNFFIFLPWPIDHSRKINYSRRAMNLSPCHFACHGLTDSVEAHRPDPSAFVFRHLKL